MTVYDRWHKKHARPGEIECQQHRTGHSCLYSTAEHLQGDRWQVRWRDETGAKRKRNFPKHKGVDPELCAEAFDAQRNSGHCLERMD